MLVFFFVTCFLLCFFFFFFQAEDGIRDWSVTGVQTCALPISTHVEQTAGGGGPSSGSSKGASMAPSEPRSRLSGGSRIGIGAPQRSQNGGAMRSIASQHGPHRGSRRRGPSSLPHTGQSAGKTRSSAAIASLGKTARDNGVRRGRDGGCSSGGRRDTGPATRH